MIGPTSPYNVDVLIIDGNTGTQIDVPPHSVARPDLNREKSGPFGLATIGIDGTAGVKSSDYGVFARGPEGHSKDAPAAE